MPKVASKLSYKFLTADIDMLALPYVAAAALPPLIEPADQPLVDRPTVEALLPVAGPRIRDLAAYHATGWKSAPRVGLLRASALARLRAAAESLPGEFGLAVFDAWRPLALQQEVFDVAYAGPTLPPGFVNPPSADPLTPPPHLTGGTVDVTLTWQNMPLALGTSFDAFDERARTAHFEATPGRVRDLRRLLYWTMRDVGFVVLNQEWWHFEYGTRRWAAITGNAPLYGAASADG